ncbi:hypothetical protein LC048_17760 [Mesobacillus subterraneus]|uniref:hypothetical protein n=1 Tax=Mesobacillus subterraneus TaxID=285983 RepID=UPI00273E5CB2|nr:hypothetical protein [Mesobacillus subterraneus]WLR54274.1 hypothetical protein LC048_17760 [Mesobacillus subterraneus]
MLGSNEVILEAFFEAFTPVLKSILIPILLWIVIPGIVTQVLLQKKSAYTIGAFIGVIAMFTIVPYSKSGF